MPVKTVSVIFPVIALDPFVAGTLADLDGNPLSGWTVALTCLDAGGAPVYDDTIRAAVTDASGAWTAHVLGASTTFQAVAYRTADDTRAVPCTVAGTSPGPISVHAHVRARSGFAKNIATGLVLSNALLSMEDAADAKYWTGAVSDASGRYALIEETDRAYNSWAITHDGTLYHLYVGAGAEDVGSDHNLLFREIAASADIEFGNYTPGFIKKYAADGSFQNLPPEWDFGGG